MNEDFISVLRDCCKNRRCMQFYKCHRLFEAGAKTDFKLVQRCQNPEVRSLLYAYFDSLNLAEAQKTVDSEQLWNAVYRELYRAANTASEGTEVYTEVNEPNPIKASKDNAWWSEVIQAHKRMESNSEIQSQESYDLMQKFVAQFEPKTEWQASLLESSEGKLTAILLPNFSKPNKNNFVISEDNKTAILEKLNSGKIPLRDSHARSLKDIVGFIKRGYESADGKIVCEATIEDSKIADLLKKYSGNVGVSLAGSGEGYCSECGSKLDSPLSGCSKHSKAPIIVKKFELREVSLTDSPAFEEAKILRYEEEE
jgi:hypothetical protein